MEFMSQWTCDKERDSGCGSVPIHYCNNGHETEQSKVSRMWFMEMLIYVLGSLSSV